MSRIREILKENRLLLSILIAVVIGFIIGSSCHEAVHSSNNTSPNRIAMYIKFPGELFIRMLKMIVVPLIMSSIIAALSEISVSSAGRLGKRTLIYYLSTSLVCSVLGLLLALVIKPGSGVDTVQETTTDTSQRNSVDNILDLFRNAFPDNLVEATFKSVSTKYEETSVKYQVKTKNISELANMTVENIAKFLQNNIVIPEPLNYSTNRNKVYVIAKDATVDFGGLMKGGGTNMIGLIVFSISFGIVLNLLKEDGKPLMVLFKSLYKATIKLVDIIMLASPVGIGSIVAGNMIETKNISSMFEAIGLLLVTDVVGLFIQAVFFYPVVYFFFLRRSPLKHLKSVLPAMITAFGTDSSAATLPTTLQCCENGVKIDERVTRFVLPVGATCNMDGTALAFGIIVPFIDQIEKDFSLGIGEIILAVIVCTLISIGAAGIPGAGLTNLIIIFEAVGLPIRNLGSILAIQWFTDRLITVINVMGDTYAAAVLEKFSLQELDGKEELTCDSDALKRTEAVIENNQEISKQDAV